MNLHFSLKPEITGLSEGGVFMLNNDVNELPM